MAPVTAMADALALVGAKLVLHWAGPAGRTVLGLKVMPSATRKRALDALAALGVEVTEEVEAGEAGRICGSERRVPTGLVAWQIGET